MSDPKKGKHPAVPPELLSDIEQAQMTAQRIKERLERIQSKMIAMQDKEETLEDFQPHRHLEQAANMLEDLWGQMEQFQAKLKGQTS